MNPVGDPYSETAALDDTTARVAREVEVTDEHVEGIHIPKLIVAIRTATGETTALAVVEEPRPGPWRLTEEEP